MAVLVSGTTADFLLAEVQFWLFALVLSCFWLSSIKETGGAPVGRPAPLGPLPVPARRTH